MMFFSLSSRLTRIAGIGTAALALAGTSNANSYFVSPTGSDTASGSLTSPFQTIHKAVSVAQAGDSVVLEDGVYTGTGNTDINLNAAISISSENGPARTVINLNASQASPHVGFHIGNVGTIEKPLTIQGITLENGYTGPNAGGAIQTEASVFSLINCVFQQNTGANGAAVGVFTTATAKITDCTFSANKCIGSAPGAALSVGGTCTVAGCTFLNNAGGSDGGAIYNLGRTTVSQSSFSGNLAGQGGAISNSASGTLNVAGCVFNGNVANGSGSYGGGAILNLNTLNVQGCLFSSNQAVEDENGGAITNQTGGTFTLVSSLLYGNSSGEGGAIFNQGQGQIEFTTMSANTAGNGGAIYDTTLQSLVLTDSVLWGDNSTNNTNQDEIADNNSISASYSDIQFGWPGTGNIKVNPLFVNAAGFNFQLQSTTPCNGVGTPISGITTDLLGHLRKVKPGMGAYESGSFWSSVAQAVGPDGRRRILWANVDGAIQLWIVPTTGTKTVQSFGPFTGWMAEDLAIGPDNDAHVLWHNATGGATIWDITPTGSVASNRSWGPYAGWTEKSISVGPDNHVSLMWLNAPGETWLWNIATNGTFTYVQYGPL